jgi:fatty-acyl-CoA synthase
MSASYASGPSAAPLLGETIGDNLRRTVLSHGRRDALVVRSQSYRATYDELWRQIGAAARGLLARGVARGDRVGIWSPNRYEWVIAQYATARIGAILVNINPAYRTAELEYVVRQAEIGVLLHAAGFRATDYRRMVVEVRPRLPLLHDVLVLDDDWDDLLAAGTAGTGASEEALAAREAELSQGRDPVAPQRAQQRLLRRRDAPARPR